MDLRVLGCSGSIAKDNRTTSFLLNDRVLVDAGTGVGDLSLDELAAIDHVLLSHSHLDHVLGIPLIADSIMRRRLAEPVFRSLRVHALPATLEALRRHLFNNVIWPDFTRLPTPGQAIVELVPVEVGQRLDLAGLHIEVLPAAHTVPACGFAVDTPSGWWVYTGDTGPNPPLWQRLRGRRVAQLVIETAFSDDERALAEMSRHHCPSSLAQELVQFDAETRVAITHIKPGEMAAVTGQIAALGIDRPLFALARGDRFSF
ncbi:MBL fold metallo-hydrolase [Sphaerotilus microaerophilus]|jgi:ribonuclease BN (tRNA processing enzyme)|uniref:cAMP phosphodiesterase class-II:metallo-beta-lactamase superfamily protein n=1 Tax=Sphaerotilus microaerophilus TaxID=2914710 RepID=A0ABM7YGA9_9BURK|nr:3',5'-cyclic-nucleotide phosphodiesterase [Sphaerotilus sp. FB-5]BDI03200.1 cAMP phosphodiesterase class-II:metallo-beta-lactamase superfamily protein [Sphaerotilus sp. FB-5]